MSITVTRPMSAPTGLSASLVSGGSLAASTTYYFIVYAYSMPDQSARVTTGMPYHSDISAEGTFTTDTTNKSAKITWTNSAEHTSNTRYDILLTTVSGSYAGKKSYACTGESMGTITDGTTGYTVTAIGDKVYASHSCQTNNVLPGALNKDLGLIKILIDGETSTTGSLPNIYAAVVAAGFSNYIYWDGYKTYKSVFDHTAKNEMTITLDKVKDLNFSKHIKSITQ